MLRILPQRRSATALRRAREGESARTIVIALRVLSLRALYTGPEEVIVVAKVHPSPRLNAEQLTRAIDDLDRRIRLALPLVADVFIDVTAQRVEGGSRALE
jgi:divalent metal cation (Fe/Co/Zn/Cd) transporter